MPSDAGFVYNELSGPYTREYTSRPCMLWAKNSDLSSYPGRSNWSQSISHHGTPHNQLRAREFGVIRVIDAGYSSDAGYLSDVIARLLQCIAGLRVTRQRCRTKDATELRDRITHDYLCNILRGVQRKADATVQFPGAYLSAASSRGR